MFANPAWTVDVTRVLTRRELVTVLADARAQAKARCVPLWWDAGTLTDLAEWQAERMRHGARGGDPFVCSVLAYRRGRPIQRAAIRRGSFGVQGARAGAAADADDSSRAAHVHFTCAGRRADAGRGAGGGGALERGDHERVFARGGG